MAGPCNGNLGEVAPKRPAHRLLTRVARHLRAPSRLPSVIWKNLKYPFTPQAAEARYDRRLGIDTAGDLDPEQLSIHHDLVTGATGYAAIPARIFDHLISRIDADPRGFTFVDAGAGKGRALLLAARYGFMKVIGVELSGQLCCTAAANVARFTAQHGDLSPIEIAHADAVEYAWPETPLVVFLYNPFQAAVMRQVAARLQQSYQRRPRRIIVVYYHAAFADAFDPSVFTRRVVTDIPRDPTDRYRRRNFQGIILETKP